MTAFQHDRGVGVAVWSDIASPWSVGSKWDCGARHDRGSGVCRLVGSWSIRMNGVRQTVSEARVLVALVTVAVTLDDTGDQTALVSCAIFGRGVAQLMFMPDPGGEYWRQPAARQGIDVRTTANDLLRVAAVCGTRNGAAAPRGQKAPMYGCRFVASGFGSFGGQATAGVSGTRTFTLSRKRPGR